MTQEHPTEEPQGEQTENDEGQAGYYYMRWTPSVGQD